jgi:hypothetical protein
VSRALRQALVLVLACAALTAEAQGEPNQRIALLIGNDAYAEAPLYNPVNDATAMAQALESLGFEVILVTDGTLEAMQSAFVDFTGRIREDATALVYYAGHGIQASGRNYLIPVDAELATERALRFEAMDVNDLVEELEYAPSRVNLVVLDACRNNPFGRSRGSRGLAAIDAAAGTLIAYATAPGSVASDGVGENGLYTEQILAALEEPGLKVEEVFKQVRVRVAELSAGDQVPWESSSLTGDFVFNQTTPAPAPAVAAAVAPASADAELMFWGAIEGSDDPVLFQDYLTRFPNGTFVTVASRRLEQLQAAADPCNDLGGRWTTRTQHVAVQSCESEMTLTLREDGRYDLVERLCGIASLTRNTGEAWLEGQVFSAEWRAPPCRGTTRVEMDASCSVATGTVSITGGLIGVCNRSDMEYRMERVGAD